MKKLQSYLMLFIFFAALIPSAAVPTPAKAQELTEVEIQPDGNSGYDGYISSTNATTNYATSTTMLIGETASDEIGKGLINWDLSTIPSDADIETAILSIWVSEDLATSAGTLQVYPVNQVWVEADATWTRYSIISGNDQLWQTAGASGADDFVDTVVGEVALADNLAVDTRIDITLDTAMMGDVLRGNYIGFLLKTELQTNDAYTFYTSDAADSTKRPLLTLEYDPSPVITDPGWLCVDATVTCAPYLNDYDVYSPFYHYAAEEDVPTSYGADYDFEGNYIALGAKINCEPYPRCRNDYPIYYTVMYTYEWTSYSQFSVYANTTVRVSGGGAVDHQAIYCVQSDLTHGICKGIMRGVILPEEIPNAPHAPDGGMDIMLKTNISFATGFPVSAGIVWDFSLSRQMPEPTCSDTYTVPVIDTYTIDPTLELPVGMANSETPTDEQGYTLEVGNIYMLRVQDGPWSGNDDTGDRYDTAISFDGTTYTPLDDFIVGSTNENLLCYDIDPFNPYYITIYFTATTEAVYIRANDSDEHDPSWFINNTNDPETPLSYSIGPAYLTDAACPQFTYSAEDMIKDIEVPSTDNDVDVYDAQMEQIIGGEWYGIKVTSGTWHEDAPTTERIDMEFSFIIFGPQLDPPPWQDLANGSPLVDCTSADGTMVFVQAPITSGLVLHLRVNDQDDPQNWTDNTGTLDVSVYHVTNTYIPSGCAEDFTLDDMVASGDVEGDQTYGEGFGNSFGSLDGWGNVVPGGVSTSYYMTPGGWYMLQTRDGPWTASSASGGTYEAGTDYYAVQIKRLSTDYDEEWNDPDEWDLATCVVNTDMLGHQRIYFRVADNTESGSGLSGTEYMIRVAGASNSTTGFIGWDLYQAVDVSGEDPVDPWNSCIQDYGDIAFDINQTWIPVKLVSGAIITQYQPGGGTIAIEAGKQYRLQTKNGPWTDGENPAERYDAELSSDGGVTWYAMGDHPDLTCAVTDQVGKYQTAIIDVEVGQVWKIRVADTETLVFTDNEGSLSYQLSESVYTPTYEPDDNWIYTDEEFDACLGAGVRPLFVQPESVVTPDVVIPTLPAEWDVWDWVPYLGDIALNAIDWYVSVFQTTKVNAEAWYISITNYVAGWFQYLNRSMISYFAWCPRHVNILLVAIHKLKDKEPLASIDELDTAADTTIAEIKSYDWGSGGEGGGLGDGYEDTSIFSFGEGGGAGAGGGAVDAVVEKILPTSGTPYDVWDGGDVVDFSSSEGLPDFYYTCGTAFANYLPSRLRDGTCFVSAYWKETGAAWWVQLSLDIFTVFMIFGMIKTAVQSLVYMMTGVRPWTKDGAIKIISTVASGENVVQSPENWRRSGRA